MASCAIQNTTDQKRPKIKKASAYDIKKQIARKRLERRKKPIERG